MLEGVGMPLVYSTGGAAGREQRRPMWTQHEKAVLRLLMRQYAGVTEFDPPDVHKHPIRNEMWRLLTARYNAHPHVRSRDTKQLRKAWENLKYRARKLGSESQRSARQQNNSVESSWPLDGVTLPGPPSPPLNNTTPREAGEVGDWRGESEEESHRNLDDIEEVEKDVKDEVEDDPLQSQESLDHTHPLSDRGPAVLNLHPLVSSLLSGGLGSLTTLPFLTSNPGSQLASGLLLPHAVSSFSTADSELCQTILRSSMDATSITSTSPTTATSAPTTTATTSGTCTSTSGASVTINGVSQAILNTSPNTTSAPSTPVDKHARTDSPAEPPLDDRLHQRLSGVETTIRHTEEQHQTQLQLLRLQIAQSVAEHEAKMRVLGAQLEYWQRRLRVQQRVSNALSSITQNDPDFEDEPPA
ncbi:myb/SANT-like DNA-binding domain-containing protein 3 [Homarus americanus]|uniref:myb/SANT-like DNA-binding domain-containing protein 3 n=1 Tax=Homarus americanus TaxID=6706 RepID=UPI001C4763A9|nr:myb/SANT-like DNA-binding domain-containing protein 3 [Homarus americanus]XP_042205713.1 myb/SANT-like DNA-binding domain-containing protein 3 [Homarus americanus]XP_042205714.1 myb/SANT-like DNA-binding domain-containing protein 3 [Homarus americanus]XP_042205715.1 myb/SANT-like DNA-binding domain-containing protein 3 [Homarus americanus]